MLCYFGAYFNRQSLKIAGKISRTLDQAVVKCNRCSLNGNIALYVTMYIRRRRQYDQLQSSCYIDTYLTAPFMFLQLLYS